MYEVINRNANATQIHLQQTFSSKYAKLRVGGLTEGKKENVYAINSKILVMLSPCNFTHFLTVLFLF